MTYYKFLRADLTSPYADYQWREGEWVDAEGDLDMCANGIHVCRPADLVHWLNETLWTVEVRGDSIAGDNKLCVRGARLVKRVEEWNDTSARLFAADCAEDVLHLFESQCPGDSRPRDAIVAARRFAAGEDDKLTAAGAAAGDAAVAAGGAAWAAWAAWAARAAAGAAGGAAWAARAAAGAAGAAAGAAGAAGGDAALRWQTARLLGVLGIEEQP